MRFFRIEEDSSSRYTGVVDGVHRWVLPGIRDCPGCGATWSGGSKTYPSVDLTLIASVEDVEEARAEPLEEYERLRECVRPFLPPAAIVEPGSSFGPLQGRGRGRFGALAAPVPWWLLIRRTALSGLQGESLQGLKACPTSLRFRERAAPDFLELELLPVGRVHPACLPPDRKPPCGRCGRRGLRLPDALFLERATLPNDLDVFRLEDFSTVVVCTERFAEACRRLGFDGVGFSALDTR